MVVYLILKVLLDENIYEDFISKDVKRVLFEMFYLCSFMINKENILEFFKCERGCIRIFVVMIVFGMGVDCK